MESSYEVIDLITNESHGMYDTLSEARGCVQFDRLASYAIWHGDVRVDCRLAESLMVA